MHKQIIIIIPHYNNPKGLEVSILSINEKVKADIIIIDAPLGGTQNNALDALKNGVIRGGCGPTVEGFAAVPYMPYLCRICAVSVPYLPIIQLIWIVGTAWSIETIPIIRMPHMP